MKIRYNEEELKKMALDQGIVANGDNVLFAVNNGMFFNTYLNASNYVYGQFMERDLIVTEITLNK